MNQMTIHDLHEKLLAKELSAVELTKTFIAHRAAAEGEIHAYLSTSDEAALAKAAAVDAKIAAGEPVSDMAGIPGALVATMGCILPSLIIVSLLSWLYEKYRSMDAMQAVLACLRPAVVALIASAALTILRVVVFAGGVVSAEAVQMLYVALFAAALVVLRVKHSNPILVMVCCGAVSLAAKLILG